MQQPVLNISAYKFVRIDDAAALREALHARALALSLKGTVLLAEEGINLFLAGTADAVRAFVQTLHADARFAGLAPKESWSEAVPFKKLLVKVKPEIIRMNHPAIRPDAQERAPALPATTRAARSRCSTRATPSRSTPAPSPARTTGASGSSATSPPRSTPTAPSSKARRW